MKRFLVFIIICVVTLSLGLTTYYFLRDNEVIIVKDSYFEVNKDDTFIVNIEHTNKKHSTEIIRESLHPDIVKYNPVNERFETYKGGRAIIRISSNRADFKPVMIEVVVGDGSISAPLFIFSAQDLANIGVEDNKPLDKSYILRGNINLETFNDGVFIPIGNSKPAGEGFSGIFNFDNHTISNLNIVQNNLPQGVEVKNAGLFATLERGAIIKNLNLENINIDGSFETAGGIAGISHGIIEKSVVSSGTINNLRAIVNTSTGGLVGKQEVVDALRPNLNMTYSAVNIMGNSLSNIGGLVGYNLGGAIANSYSNSELSGEINSNIGGLVGKNSFKTIDLTNFEGILKDNYYYGDIVYQSSQTGAIIGVNIDKDLVVARNLIRGNYYSSEVNEGITGIGGVANEDLNELVGIFDKTLDELRIKETYYSYTLSSSYGGGDVYWSFVRTWNINATFNNGLPTLDMQSPVPAIMTTGIVDGVSITSVNDLRIMEMTGKVYVLRADLDLSSTTNWEPIGTEANPFNSTLEVGINPETGDYYQIKYLSIISSTGPSGLFGYIGESGRVKGIHLREVNIISGTSVGAVAAYNRGIIEDSKVINSSDTARVLTGRNSSGDFNIGGIVGTNLGTVLNAYSQIKISVVGSLNQIASSGGIIGNNSGDLHDSNSQSEMLGEGSNAQFIGGIVGYNIGTIEKVHFLGNIRASENSENVIVGGLVGFLNSSGVVRYSFVAPYGLGGNYQAHSVGALVGESHGTVSESYADVIVIKARYAGGLAFNIESGQFVNTYTHAYMTGINNKSVKSGFAYYIGYKSKENSGKVINSFSAATFDLVGDNYAETYAPIRNEGLLIVKRQAGYVIDSIYDAQNQSLKKQAFTSLLNWEAPVPKEDREISVTTDHAMGTDEKQFSTFRQAGFNSSIWAFEAGNYPTLRNTPPFIE